ncbi:hypothetical protein M3226_30845 [Neobacillus cucumis]|uniref:hypothetical protein n=1 Tax=Neobacillus cucumis TaxID=1740721 RepID=UPI00203F1E68|nr:hypothetical protein [Neobacillus cucumis]MCM3729923.1 hypothetical protein [Neobacillus cucumis]
MKVARWVWSRGKDGDYIKVLPIAIKVTGARVEEPAAIWWLFLILLTGQLVQ